MILDVFMSSSIFSRYFYEIIVITKYLPLTLLIKLKKYCLLMESSAHSFQKTFLAERVAFRKKIHLIFLKPFSFDICKMLCIIAE